MGQLGFFDADKRLAALSAKGDPLEAHRSMTPWERFRADIETVVLTLSFTQFCGWVSRTAFQTPPHSGRSARSLPGPGLLRVFDHFDRHLAAKGYIAR